jgi:hypothetical protein
MAGVTHAPLRRTASSARLGGGVSFFLNPKQSMYYKEQ